MSAQEKYDELIDECTELSSIEALRLFCSLAMSGQDWIDLEKFFRAVEKELSTTQQNLEEAKAECQMWQVQLKGEREECDKLLAEAKNKVSQKPFGYWHVGNCEDECEFFLASESGDVSCPDCITLYAAPQPETDRGSND